MKLSCVKVWVLAPLAILAVAFPASSGERDHRHHRQGGHHKEQSVIGSAGLPSVVPGIGTFVGSISAVRIKGNGVFVAVNRTPRSLVVDYRPPKARIIEVSAENTDEACHFQAGVCIIRPKK
ncbi:hypothetical protein [Peteryoungia ipomoeae]|uniref:Uncharacterized protein n=1 Tax=Peteryoungia ipomoeae TaxID=1210932 RepID=A0A4S8NXN5_9HYPH|nr:hypothetical protein [Peteryoungia ipomoeae]THV22390.1 hypothetical protein FAA97_13995 [Peteryoungia ipomoeae]